jgi:hypothetical protein
MISGDNKKNELKDIFWLTKISFNYTLRLKGRISHNFNKGDYMLLTSKSLFGYLRIRRMLERHGFKQLLSSSQHYVLWGMDKTTYLIAHSYGGEGKFFVAVSKHIMK